MSATNVKKINVSYPIINSQEELKNVLLDINKKISNSKTFYELESSKIFGCLETTILFDNQELFDKAKEIGINYINKILSTNRIPKNESEEKEYINIFLAKDSYLANFKSDISDKTEDIRRNITYNYLKKDDQFTKDIIRAKKEIVQYDFT